jgi:cyclophilin family peptidyl-prolyl cis-trans isomerase
MKKQLLAYLSLVCIFSANPVWAQTRLTFYTNKGTFVAEMYEDKRPITTKNFIDLTKKKFYDKMIFHRVIKDFVIQSGDPTGTGSGGSGVTIPDELTPPVSNLLGTFGMANIGKPNTADSQFYINLKDNTSLDKAYTAFAKVISGMTVVQAIGAVKTDSHDKPITNVWLDSVRITSPITNIDETAAIESLGIYPNPVNRQSVLAMNAITDKTVELSIYNQQGQLVARLQKRLPAGTTTIPLTEIQESDFKPGIYYLTVSDGLSVAREKFVITE